MFALVEASETALQTLVRERRELDAREAAWLAKVAAYERSEEWRADGYMSARAALRDACRMTHGTARGTVDLARKLERLPRTRAAFAAGDISRHHAGAIANAFAPEREHAIEECEPVLVDAARRVTPRELAVVVQRISDAIDGDGGAAREQSVHARRRLHVSVSIDGVGFVDGRLDHDGVEVVSTALDAEMRRDRQKDETRAPEQRRHDALVNICRRALDRAEVGGERRARPHLIAVADLERLTGDVDLLTEARAESAHLGHLSQAMLERIACDCDVTRVLMTGKSEVVDVGRATRKVPHRLWKALVARDRHCQAAGCSRSPWQCEAHHIRHWIKGGPTDLANLTLLCWEHHRQAHVCGSGIRTRE
jgi:hypothetical protein